MSQLVASTRGADDHGGRSKAGDRHAPAKVVATGGVDNCAEHRRAEGKADEEPGENDAGRVACEAVRACPEYGQDGHAIPCRSA